MKKLLFQFDTDPHPAVFDTVVAYDGGADHVSGFGGVTPDNISGLVEGAIFTRAPKDKKYTAIFIGGSDMIAGQNLLKAVQAKFFPGFQVSVMLDSNGGNTTAAAAVAKLAQSGTLTGKKAVVLAGTGPVGQRAAVMLCREGAEVTMTGRQYEKTAMACKQMADRFGVDIVPVAAADADARGRAIESANIVFATGAAGIQLIGPEHWQNNANIELIADANATPPIGIGGIELFDKGIERYGKIVWGALGFGPLKLELQRACIGQLFTDNKLVYDAENIFELAKTMA